MQFWKSCSRLPDAFRILLSDPCGGICAKADFDNAALCDARPLIEHPNSAKFVRRPFGHGFMADNDPAFLIGKDGEFDLSAIKINSRASS